ncbi:DUF3261 domain-containing protein [Zestomonas carbonaria]|uniref:Lipoprotein n=1 Tax=Zestomonas carbonaria TaxID=2762745 RepID=A0A7U7EL60_9GAMM|nr:DUF3261 domain-containing protein [Pseudomonas carbonaria]CAD5106492.1 hypothetical protein PSEWESI4_00755 [Pseudomonas carbonaria]
MIRALLLGLSLLLTACATTTPLPSSVPELDLPLSLHVQRDDGATSQDWLLVVQEEADTLRWSLFDPLGVPLARQQLIDGEWHNDGLLPPNAEARQLFAALLFALVPAQQLAHTYPPGEWTAADGQRRLNPDWRIGYRAPLNFTLNRVEGPRYRVTALIPDSDS